jgi:hypothetical protein
MKPVPVVSLRHFTTLAGAGTFTGLPIDVRKYESLSMTLWRGKLLGSSPTFKVSIEESADKARWAPIVHDVDPGDDTESTAEVQIRHRYLRWRVDLAGTDVMATTYLHGVFYPRRSRLAIG